MPPPAIPKGDGGTWFPSLFAASICDMENKFIQKLRPIRPSARGDNLKPLAQPSLTSVHPHARGDDSLRRTS